MDILLLTQLCDCVILNIERAPAANRRSAQSRKRFAKDYCLIKDAAYLGGAAAFLIVSYFFASR